MSRFSFSGVGGPREGGRTTSDMNGAFISGGTRSGERERCSQSMSVAHEMREVLYSVTAFWKFEKNITEPVVLMLRYYTEIFLSGIYILLGFVVKIQ